MDNYIVPDKVYCLNKNEVLLAVFDKDDEEPIINPQIEKTQNAESVFTFSISPNNPKWFQINNPENLYVVDGKVYSTNFEGCFTEIISENNEDLIQVKAYERQKLLSRKFVRAWNSETGFEIIDSFMVVILSNGDLQLKNNGTVVNSTHQKGTSGYVLDGLLYGTGWTTGICDVEGTFDFETEQVDIYENILKVQEIWGGILVFDSINKVVHHRNETTWLPYNGYEVKYQKNMQSLEKLYNNKIITKLCPLGEGGLNIKAVNNNSEWLTNYTYTDTVLEGIENNPDISDASQLKRWGQRKLQDLCKPRTELTVQAALLYQVEGYELERVDLNDIVDVINLANSNKVITQLRVVGFTYKLWDYSDATLELSDITLDSTDIFKKNIQATNQINAGTLDTTQVVSFFRAGQTVEKSLRNIDNAVAEIIINEDSIVSTVKNGGLNFLEGTNNTEWKSVTCSRYAGHSPALPDLTDIADLGLKAGDNITYSLYLKTNSGKKLRARIEFYNSQSDRTSIRAGNDYIIQNGEGFSFVTGAIPEGYQYINLYIDASLTAETITGTTTEYIKAEKLEKGSIPTVWTPSIGDYSTRTESIQTSEEITNTAIKELKNDERNLIIDTANKAINNLNSTTGSRKEYAYINMGQSYMNVSNGSTVTLSFDLEMQVNTANPTLRVYNTNRKGPKRFDSQTLTFSNYQVGSVIKQRCAVTSTITNISNADFAENYIEFYSTYDTSNWFKISNIKLELGDTATPWSPSLNELSTIMSQTASSVEISATEKESGTKAGIVIKLKNSNGTDLAEGEANITLSGLVKFTDLSTSGSTTINGANITTGIIKSQNYEANVSGMAINLNTGVISSKNFKVYQNGDVSIKGSVTSESGNIGGFTLGSTEFTGTLNGIYDYSEYEAIKALIYSIGLVNIPSVEFNIYDVNNSGTIDSNDALAILKHIEGIELLNKTITGTVKINSKDPKNCFQILKNNLPIVSIGVGGINSTSISTKSFICGTLSSRQTIGVFINGDTGELFSRNINGVYTTVAPTYVSSQEFRNTSLAELKKNITELGETLNLIKNSTIYEYNYKTENNNTNKHKGFVIGEGYNAPEEVMSTDKQGIDVYSMCSILWRGMQEIIERI